jgi:hypothetical protein
VAASWGSELTADGKTVWADLPVTGRREDVTAPWWPGGPAGGTGTSRGEAAKPARSGRTEHGAAAPAPPREPALARAPERPQRGGRDRLVWYLCVPAGEFLAMRAGVEALLREATLISLRATQSGLPEPLSELARRATTRFPAARMAASAPPDPAAVDEEMGTGDFAVAVPPGTADQLRGFEDAVRGINEWCESGYLLVAPLTPALLELHSWATEEALYQLELGAEPRPFLPAAGRAGR